MGLTTHCREWFPPTTREGLKDPVGDSLTPKKVLMKRLERLDNDRKLYLIQRRLVLVSFFFKSDPYVCGLA